MNKSIFIAVACIFILACNNNTNVVVDEQKQRDSIDAAQRIKDSIAVEAKMLEDMAADTTSNKVPAADVPSTNQ